MKIPLITTLTRLLFVLIANAEFQVLANENPGGDGRSIPVNRINAENSETEGRTIYKTLVSQRNGDIEGFSPQFSVNAKNPENPIDFKIDSKKEEAYIIEIYRLGYYGGFGARKIGVATHLKTKKQNSYEPKAYGQSSKEPDSVESKLVDCDKWEITDRWNVPQTAVSGVYLAYLKPETSKRGNYILFIVRNDSSKSDIMFKTSDPTWQAYNRYKDRCFYGSPKDGKSVPAVSYNRPITLDVESNDYFFQSEFRLLRWLERNGYDVKYCSSKDVAFPRENSFKNERGNKIRILLSVGHDEYWSLEERRYFEAARESGIHLCFFSGNECYWKTRWEGSGSTTLVCYKKGESKDKNFKDIPWTGLWREYRKGKEPECDLSGQMSWVKTAESHTISVPEKYGKHPFWKNTEIQNGGGHKEKAGALMNGLLGYEWNYHQTEFEHGSELYFAGIVKLSYVKLRKDQWQPKKGKPWPDVADDDWPMKHFMTLYKHKSSDSLVFAAGTTNFAFGLDNLYSGEIVHMADRNLGSIQVFREDARHEQIDPNIQQATMNLLSHMGSDPTSMQDDLSAPVSSPGNWNKYWKKP